MDDETRAKIGMVAGKLVQQVIDLGLTWDQSAEAFGLAAKAAARAAAFAAENANQDCVAIARTRLSDAFAQDVQVVISIAEPPTSDDAVKSNSLMTIMRRRYDDKLH